MKNKKTIIAINDFIDTAEKSIKNAKKLLKDLIKQENLDLNSEINLDTRWLHSYNDDNNKIIEWVFTWEEMIDNEQNRYPVPVNYSSKSKLVQWDRLKLTIAQNWRMTYKQIAPIERENKVGLLTENKGKYQVVTDWETYDVLTAAVTHFKGNIWDKVTIILPKWKPASFAAIDAIIPA